jgi:hypothetical protein
MDCDRLGHLTVLTSLGYATFPETLAWDVEYVQEERSLEFA